MMINHLFCGKAVDDSTKTVDRGSNLRKTELPKVRVKVPKEAFDKVLGKLIKAKPVKRA
jgi:hypothetical protein